jgi:hypothetical protein
MPGDNPDKGDGDRAEQPKSPEEFGAERFRVPTPEQLRTGELDGELDTAPPVLVRCVRSLIEKYEGILMTNKDGTKSVFLKAAVPGQGNVTLTPDTSGVLTASFFPKTYPEDAKFDLHSYQVDRLPGGARVVVGMDEEANKAPQLTGQVPDELRGDLIEAQIQIKSKRFVTHAEMEYIHSLAEQAEPVPVSYERLFDVALSRQDTPLEASPEASKTAVQDFIMNTRHFLGKHGARKLYDEYNPGDPEDEDSKQYLEVEVGEENDMHGGTMPFVRARLNRPIAPHEREHWFGTGAPAFPYRVHDELNYTVVDSGGVDPNHREEGEPSPANKGEEPRDLWLMTLMSGRVMLGEKVELNIVTKVNAAESSEAWMAAHFIWDGKPKIHKPIDWTGGSAG